MNEDTKKTRKEETKGAEKKTENQSNKQKVRKLHRKIK